MLLGLRFVLRQASVGATHAATARRPLLNPAEKTESAEAGGASTVAAAIKALRQVPGVQTIQLHSPHASIGEPSPHGALGIDGGAPAPAPPLELPPLELPPPEPPLDAEGCPSHRPSSCSARHRCRCNMSGPGCRPDLLRFRAFGRLLETSPTTMQ